MQAGLTTRRLTLREIFPPAMVLWVSEKVMFGRNLGRRSMWADASGGIATIDDGSTAVKWSITTKTQCFRTDAVS